MQGGTVCLLCVLSAPTILQGVGLFTPKWVSTDTCHSKGIIYDCCHGEDNSTCATHDLFVNDVVQNYEGLDVRALGLHCTAFAVMFMTILCVCCETCCHGSDTDTGICGLIGACCFMLYPVAGLFSFIGCMLLVPKYKTSELGYSFILCLTSACFTLLVTIILCGSFCSGKNNDDGRHASRAVQSFAGYGAVNPYGGGVGAVRVQAATVEQRAVVHDPETGSFFVLIRKMNVVRMVSAFGHDSD